MGIFTRRKEVPPAPLPSAAEWPTAATTDLGRYIELRTLYDDTRENLTALRDEAGGGMAVRTIGVLRLGAGNPRKASVGVHSPHGVIAVVPNEAAALARMAVREAGPVCAVELFGIVRHEWADLVIRPDLAPPMSRYAITAVLLEAGLELDDEEYGLRLKGPEQEGKAAGTFRVFDTGAEDEDVLKHAASALRKAGYKARKTYDTLAGWETVRVTAYEPPTPT